MFQITGRARELSRPGRRLRSRLSLGPQFSQPLCEAHMASTGLRRDDLIKQVAEATLVPGVMSPHQLRYQLGVCHGYLPPTPTSYAIVVVKIYS
jgi:hypothetical protein